MLVTLFAIACSWYAVEMQKAAKRRAAVAEITRLGGEVRYYDATDPNTLGEPPRWFSLLRKLHGDEYLGNAVGIDFVFVSWQDIDAGVVHLKALTDLEFLWFRDMQITEERVKKLQQAMPDCKISREF